VLVKKSSALLESYSHVAPYMQDTLGHDEISPADCSPELTKHFRGLRLWLPLHLHGLEAFRANLEEKFLLCRYFYTGIKRMGFETGPEPELSVALFRYPAANRDEFNRKLLSAIQADGRCSFSSTEIDGELWIRCAVLNFRSHLPEIKLALKMIGENVERIR
jgi:aromatic-L-amino-acid decarboxylase